MKHIMIAIVKLYRKFISPLKPPCCRFTPTCSQYAIEAFSKRGFFVGFILSVWRILRCNPFCRSGYDPVPERGLRNKHKVGEIPPPEFEELPKISLNSLSEEAEASSDGAAPSCGDEPADRPDTVGDGAGDTQNI